MNKNITLNKVHNKFSLFFLKKIIILSIRFFGFLINKFNKNIFIFTTKDSSKCFFFGYHDKKPFNYKNSKIIVHSYEKQKILEKQTNKEVFINLINLSDKKITKIDFTKAWSWQLGSSLQWHPYKDIFYYNKIIKNKPITIQYDLKKKLKKKLNFSIYNLSSDGRYFALADFHKIAKLRKGYGFTSNSDQKIDIKDKLLIYCNKTKSKKILHTFNNEKDTSIVGSYINHLTFSPDNTKISYFRTIVKKNNQRQIFFYYYCLKKKRNFLFKQSETHLISHYCWKNKNEIMFTMKSNNKKYSYKIYNILNQRKKTLSSNLNKDGHPMFNPKYKNLFVSDTYPNLFGFQKLFVYSILKKKIIWKKYLYSPYNYKGIVRCDLHPRWSNDGKKILVDYVHNSDRNIGIFNLV